MSCDDGFGFFFANEQKEKVQNHNYNIKDNLAYTEDNILVYNLYVLRIPKKATNDEVLQYFSAYGKVLRVRLSLDRTRKKRAQTKNGFIDFAKPEAAATVLVKPEHVIRGKRLSIKAGDSWHQPDGKMAYSPPSRKTDSEAPAENLFNSISVLDENKPTLHSLNDDCLLALLNFMEMRDQIQFSRVCCRFQNLFADFVKLKHKHFDFEALDHLTLWEIRDFLLLAGPSMESIIGAIPFKDNDRIVELIIHNCKKIQKINFDDCKLREPVMRNLLLRMDKVTVLTLIDCSLQDTSVELIHKMKHLRELTLAENYEITGKFISKITTLKKLNLYGCRNIQSPFLNDMFPKLNQLEELDIRRCERLFATTYVEMVRHSKNLRILKISAYFAQYEKVALLPNLRRLDVLSSCIFGRISEELFTELARHKADTLEHLRIVGSNCVTASRILLISELKQLKSLTFFKNDNLTDSDVAPLVALTNLEELVIKRCSVTNAGLLNIIRACKKLRLLNVQRCARLTSSLVFDAIDLVKETNKTCAESERRKKPLVLYLAGTSIDPSTADDARYNEAVSLLQISFELQCFAKNGDGAVDAFDMLDDEFTIDDDDDDDDDDFDYDSDDWDVDAREDLYMYDSDDMLDDVDMDLAVQLLNHHNINAFAEHDNLW